MQGRVPDRYARPGKGWTDRDEARWPVPYWYIDTGFTALLILLAVVDEGLGAVFFGIPPENMADFRSQYGVPEQWTPIGAIAIGHPDPASTGPARAGQATASSLGELVHRGHWYRAAQRPSTVARTARSQPPAALTCRRHVPGLSEARRA